MRTSELDYELPETLIATRPVAPRDASRLMVISRSDPGRLEHLRFVDLPGLLGPGDVLTSNVSKVLPARFLGARAGTGGKIEGLFLDEPSPGCWTVMIKSNTVLRPGQRLELHGSSGDPSAFSLELIGRDEEQWRVRVRAADGRTAPSPASSVLADVGATPLPPYILARRKRLGEAPGEARDRRWYQTVYADDAHAGSVAAPTAGLHFTDAVLAAIESRGVGRAFVALHVGPGTFRPVETDALEDHRMHAEAFEIPGDTIRAIEAARREGGRSVVVGTTAARALESGAHPPTAAMIDGGLRGRTDLFIRPGFAFRWTDALITNFHLPRSTLLAMVASLLPGGVPRLLEAYREAVRERYRFYSYGDAMLILP